MNAFSNASNLATPNFSRKQLPSCCFTSLPQAIGCANQFFMEGFNVQIIARDKNSFLVVSPETARQMFTKGFRLLYGH
ncbi:hypothetical protein EHT87_23925 [Larkinella knui]|uniref:Uncharacterized protein n=1 Tax=Larkinella knui TaxID=2025310 RepID=A0A3P1CE71_9BACT|nr:hypothetical protein EHT87_23925 [Larkinella knui]